MRIASLPRKLTREHVRKTPDVQGVYALWDGAECVYVGHTPWNISLRDQLRKLHELQQQGVIELSHFTWETTPTPKTREGELVSQIVEKQGRLPRYNRPGSPLQPESTCVTDLRARL
jgi:hypothetical protein